MSCLHFVGFRDERYYNAIRIFGKPDFIHRNWDVRAKQEAVPGDVIVFATGNEFVEPKHPSWDDSEQDIRTWEWYDNRVGSEVSPEKTSN